MGPAYKLGTVAAAVAIAAAAWVAAACCRPVPAAAGGFSYLQMPARGVALPGSPYRWQALAVPGEDRTIVARVDRRGGEIGRWWSLRGRWHIAAPAYDGAGAGLSGDEGALVLSRYDPAPRGMRTRTHLALLDTGPLRPRHAPRAFRRITLRGDFGVYAIAPDASTLFLSQEVAFSPRAGWRFRLRAYDLRRGRLLPPGAIRGARVFAGAATTRLRDASGHRVYTLYQGAGGRLSERRMYLLALDTFGRTLSRAALPQLRGYREQLQLRLHLDAAGHWLTVRQPVRHLQHLLDERTVARIDLRTLAPPPRPAPGPIVATSHVVGESTRGRPIELKHIGDFSLPGRLLVFGCTHGDECGAGALEPLENGCPDPDVNAFLVPNLDPDGSAVRSRLNGRGVDLNRNFPAGWRPIGAPGSLEYAGPRPFSEPEARLAARLVRRIRPRATIWFHQDWGGHAYVRAWGHSVSAGRRFAKLAGIAFRLMRWPAGTAPNWQNHRFPGAASFVVETPRGKLSPSLRSRLTAALSGLGEEVGDDPGVPRKG